MITAGEFDNNQNKMSRDYREETSAFAGSSESSARTDDEASSALTEEEEAEEDDNDAIEFVMLPSHEQREISEFPCPKLTDSLFAKQMAELSMRDREEVYFDIHGVSGIIDEEAEPGFLDRKLVEMNQELGNIASENKNAYLTAYSANSRYVSGRDLRLRFLRGDRFDAKLAAQRYVNHYEMKLELFGEETIGRDIIQDDLDEETLDALYCPFNQLLPQRDRAGRAVFLFVGNRHNHNYSQRALMRRSFYNAMLVSDDVETQRKGIVPILYGAGQFGGSGGVNRIWKMGQMFKSLPLRVVAIHFCYSNLTWLPIMSTVRLATDLCSRMRFRAHRGSHSECIYTLQTFGIPTNVFPIDENGQILSETYRKFLSNRRVQEKKWKEKHDSILRYKSVSAATTDSTDDDDTTTTSSFFSSTNNRIAVPSSYDVLLGRGKGYFTHVGNVRYRSLIDEQKEIYEKSTKEVKKQMTEEVVASIQKSGGRFLKADGNGGWILVEGEVARLKVSHSFRAVKKIPTTKKKNQPEKSVRTTSSGEDGNEMAASSDQPTRRTKRTRAA